MPVIESKDYDQQYRSVRSLHKKIEEACDKYKEYSDALQQRSISIEGDYKVNNEIVRVQFIGCAFCMKFNYESEDNGFVNTSVRCFFVKDGSLEESDIFYHDGSPVDLGKSEVLNRYLERSLQLFLEVEQQVLSAVPVSQPFLHQSRQQQSGFPEGSNVVQGRAFFNTRSAPTHLHSTQEPAYNSFTGVKLGDAELVEPAPPRYPSAATLSSSSTQSTLPIDGLSHLPRGTPSAWGPGCGSDTVWSRQIFEDASASTIPSYQQVTQGGAGLRPLFSMTNLTSYPRDDESETSTSDSRDDESDVSTSDPRDDESDVFENGQQQQHPIIPSGVVKERVLAQGYFPSNQYLNLPTGVVVESEVYDTPPREPHVVGSGNHSPSTKVVGGTGHNYSLLPRLSQQQKAIQHFTPRHRVFDESREDEAKRIAAIVIQREFRGVRERSQAPHVSSASPQTRPRVISATQINKYTLINPDVHKTIPDGAGNVVSHIWHDTDRLNKYNVLTRAYIKGRTLLNSAATEQDIKRVIAQNAEEMMLNILKVAASQAGVSDKDILNIILEAKQYGGISYSYHKDREGTSNPIYTDNVEKNPVAAKFSAIFQTLCGECGIMSGRNLATSLRLTFLPETVINNLEGKLACVNLGEAQRQQKEKAGLVARMEDRTA